MFIPRYCRPDKVVKAVEKLSKVTEDKLMEYLEEFTQKLTEVFCLVHVL